MSLTRCEVDTNVISNLPDSPNLGAQELKLKFDEAVGNLKDYVNDVLLSEIESLVATEKSNLIKSISDKILADNKKKYYVGKIIMDTKNINPATYLGFGTWQLWGKGRVPIGVNADDSSFSTVEKTGGSKTHTHSNSSTGSTTLTVSQLPKHQHALQLGDGTSLAGKSMGIFTNRVSGHDAVQTTGKYTFDTVSAKTTEVGSGSGHTHTMSATGSSSSLPPYVTCYMWKRVS